MRMLWRSAVKIDSWLDKTNLSSCRMTVFLVSAMLSLFFSYLSFTICPEPTTFETKTCFLFSNELSNGDQKILFEYTLSPVFFEKLNLKDATEGTREEFDTFTKECLALSVFKSNYSSVFTVSFFSDRKDQCLRMAKTFERVFITNYSDIGLEQPAPKPLDNFDQTFRSESSENYLFIGFAVSLLAFELAFGTYCSIGKFLTRFGKLHGEV